MGLPAIILGLCLLLLAGGMMWAHRRTWLRHRDEENLSETHRRFFNRQFRRRMQTSGMLGLVGIAMILSPLARAPLWLAGIWSVVMFLVLWVLVLALIDVIDTQSHFRRIKGEELAEQVKLEAKAKALREQKKQHRHQTNGHG